MIRVLNVLLIFDKTIKYIGEHDSMSSKEDKFLKVKSNLFHDQEFWTHYFNLKTIYQKMKIIKNNDNDDDVYLKDLYKLLSIPYSKYSLELSFKVINGNIFEELNKQNFKKQDKRGLSFNEDKSILKIKDYYIKIAKQKKKTNEHKLLSHILINNKDNISDDFYYSEIAQDEFGDLESYKDNTNSWKRYYKACESINSKIEKQTDYKINKLLIYNSGQKGKVNINKKYL